MRHFKDMSGFENEYLRVLSITDERDASYAILWKCECKHCGNKEWLITGSRMKRVQGCNKCQAVRREFPVDSRVCTVCNSPFTARSNTRTKTCSAECKKRLVAKREKDKRASSIETKLRATISGCLSRRKTRKDSYLDADAIVKDVSSRGWVCCKTRIPFQVKGPFAPSIDRIDPSRPYVPDNIQVVCWIYNRCKSVDGDADVLFFAQELVKQSEERIYVRKP